MSRTAAVITTMESRGLSAEDILAVVKAMADDKPSIDPTAEKRRAYDRDRKAKQRAANMDIPPENSTGKSTGKSTGLPPDNPSLININKPPLQPSEPLVPSVEARDRKKQRKADGESNMLAVFAELGDELAGEIVSHRKGRGSAPTIYACELLMAEFKKTGDPSAAAKMMIRNGWKGFQSEWFENEQRKSSNRQGAGAGQRGHFDSLMSGLAGLPSQRSTDGFGRRDDLRGPPADNGTAGKTGSTEGTIDASFIRLTG